MKKRLVLIDLDDTLWDTEANNRASLLEIYTALGWGQYFVSFEDYYNIYIQHNAELWRAFAQGSMTKELLSIDRLRYPLLPYEQHSDDEWLEIDRQFVARICLKRQLCTGAIDVLEYVRDRGYKVCILSNGFGEVQHTKIKNSGLSPYVDVVILSDEVGYAKPDRRIFELALERMSATAAEAVMVGDSWDTDVVGAYGAGIEVFWYNRWRLDDYPSLGGDTSVTTITELEQLRAYL